MTDFFERRRLTRALNEIEKERNQCLQREHTNQEGMNAIIKADEKSKPLRESLNRLNSKQLVKKAQQRGIDIPGECWHYVKDPMFPGLAPLDWYLEEGGQRTVANLIKKESRANIEWWVKVVSP